MTKPNLFNFATSELSQDAFICWILDHANPKHTDIDPQLHNVAISIINRFLELANEPQLTLPIDPESFKVIRQFQNIDVLLIVNEYVFIIEDKTQTNAHSDQLNRYVKKIEEHTKYKNHKIIGIFFKPFDQSNYDRIIKDNFYPFLRSDLLTIFNQYPNIPNNIYQDFSQYILNIENDVEAYKTKSFDEWKSRQKVGFLKALQDKFSAVNIVSNWSYVANPTGGFMNLYWGGQGDANTRQYLQLEISNQNEIKLNIRLSTPSKEETSPIRRKCVTFYENAFKNNTFNFIQHIKKVDRLGSGRSVALVQITQKFEIDPTKPLNVDDMFNFLKEATEFLSLHYWTAE